MHRQPAIFVSHGSPLILIEDSPARDFLVDLGQTLRKPDAIIAVSAHWMTGRPAVSVAAHPETVHDFGGFPAPLYEITYPAPGDPALGAKALSLLEAAGVEADGVTDYGNDHGTWVPLRLMFPDASIPVVQVAVQPHRDAASHYQVGQALQPLRDENVLILGSGAMTHNLRAYFSSSFTEPPAWSTAFLDWFYAALRENRRDALLAVEAEGPHYRENHPTPEHFLPFFTVMGAASPEVTGASIHRSYDAAVLAMDAVRFD